MRYISDWEKHLKKAVDERKKIGYLQDSVRIDCFDVSLMLFKSGLEDLFDRFVDFLATSLQVNISGNICDVLDFIQSSLDVLNKQPQKYVCV